MMHVDDLVDDVADALADDTSFGIGKALGRVALFDAAGNPLPDLGAILARDDPRRRPVASGSHPTDGGVQCAPQWLRTKLRANESWADIPLAERATLMVHGVLEGGPLRSHIANWDRSQLAHRELLDDGIPHWFSRVLPEGSLVEYAEIEALAIEVSHEQFSGGLVGITQLLVASRLSELFEVLEVAGIITWHDLETRSDPITGTPLIASGAMTLTPLGRAAMVDPVRAANYTFATVDDLVDADGLTLVNAVASLSLDDDDALATWQPDRSTTDRARLLADAALGATFPVQRLAAFDLLGQLQPLSAVGPVVRELLDTHCSGHAAAFLLEHDLAGPDEVGMFVDIGPFVDMLHTVSDEPAALDEVFRQAQAIAFDDLIDDLWRHDQPETVEVLEALGRHLTDKPRAKAARKAVIKHRSWLANR